VIFLHDLTRAGEAAYEAGDAAIASRLHLSDPSRVLHVFNKSDAAPVRADAIQGLCLSARTGDGMHALRRTLLERAGWHANPEGVFIARTRHVQALTRTAAHLEQAQALADRADAALELLAEELRAANFALGQITGTLSADDLLGEIFGRFCIGK
jgi:tRNA modification GTPase